MKLISLSLTSLLLIVSFSHAESVEPNAYKFDANTCSDYVEGSQKIQIATMARLTAFQAGRSCAGKGAIRVGKLRVEAFLCEDSDPVRAAYKVSAYYICRDGSQPNSGLMYRPLRPIERD